MDEVKTQQEMIPATEEAVAPVETQTASMTGFWGNAAAMKAAYGTAKLLAGSTLVPEGTYRNNPGNCLIALEMASRLNMPPLAVMQNLFIIQGKPAWSGQFCTAVVNGSGRFSPLEFVTLTDENGKMTGMYAKATRISTGTICEGPPVTWDMVKGEKWLDKAGSKWKTMPEVMFGYRAAAFFTRRFCPDLLCGIQTAEEVQDVKGYQTEQKTVITFD